MNKFGTAVVLAGGKSSRMGFDKQLIKTNGELLMDKILQKLKGEFEEVIIVSNKPELYQSNQYRVVCDLLKDRGPLGGIYTGLEYASSQMVYFLACDMPYINLNYIRYLKDRLRNMEVEACITKVGMGIEPFNGFYSKNLKEYLKNHLDMDNKASVYYFLKKQFCLYIEECDARRFCPNLNMFLNLNTSKELLEYNTANGLS